MAAVEFSTDLVRFVNENRKKQETFYLHNRAGLSKKLRVAIAKQSNKAFRLVSSTSERVVAAGLKLPVIVQYSPDKEADLNEENDRHVHEGRLEVYADEKMVLTVPVMGEPPFPLLTVSPSVVKFGCLVMANQTASTSFTISNIGTAASSFQLTSSPCPLPPSLSVAPLEGEIAPSASQEIKVQLLCREVGDLKQKLLLHTTNTTAPPVEVTITASIVQRRLVLKEPSSLTAAPVVHLGPAYYGMTRSSVMMLYNDSPATTSYITTIDTHCPGTEHGADVSSSIAKATTSGGLHQASWREQGQAPPINELITVTPSEGTLSPYESRAVQFSFCPSFQCSSLGWSHHQGQYCRRDYAILVMFNTVELQHTSTDSERGGDSVLEVAVTASAHPVTLSFIPETGLQFSPTPINHSQSQQLTLTNNSDTLPISFKCRVPAHYKVSQKHGKIPPQKSVSVEVTFLPHQMGCLDGKLCVDVLERESVVVETVMVPLRGTGEKNVMEQTKEEKRKRSAQVNDLAASIRPHDSRVLLRTHFTKKQRHTYIDPDYAYTEEEVTSIERHRQHYRDYLSDLREKRLHRCLHKKLAYSHQLKQCDIGIKPAEGLTPPVLDTSTIDQSCSTQPNNDTNNMVLVESPATKPSTIDQVDQCHTVLTPRQLSNIIIKPCSVEYGEMVINTQHTQDVQLYNHLNQHVMITFKASCPSLSLFIPAASTKSGNTHQQQQSSLSLILPPSSYTTLSVALIRNTTGSYHQSIQVNINRNSPQHIPVSATGVNMSLRLSTSSVTLEHRDLAPPTQGLQGNVCLYNPHTVPASFKWEMSEEAQKSLYITHPEGVVPPLNSLLCEFVAQGSFHCPPVLPLSLLVDGGQEQEVECAVHYGVPQCSFDQSNVLFGAVPLNLTTSKSIVLKNTGKQHAYYTVLNSKNSISCLTVTPSSGCVPAGGSTAITLTLRPTAQSSRVIDGPLKIKLREGQVFKLRVAARVETPRVMIDKGQFCFGGVECGSECVLPFSLINNGATRAKVTFDLSAFPDFTVILPPRTINGDESSSSAVSPLTSSSLCTAAVQSITVQNNSSVQCKMIFAPKEVAAYDCLLPVLVNDLKAPSPPPSQWPPSHTPSLITVDGPLPSLEDTPCRRLLATALRQSYQPPTIRIASPTHQPLPSGAPVSSGHVSTSPACITVHPVPLRVTVEAQFVVMVDDTPSNIDLSVSLPEGYSSDPLITISFLDDSLSASASSSDGAASGAPVEVPCIITFCSSRPISVTDHFTITNTRTGQNKQIPFSVAADNNVFTVYEFLSRHLNSSTIQTDQYGVPSLTLSPSSSFTPDTLSSRVSLLSSASLRDNNFASTTSSSADYADMFLQDCMSALCRYIAVNGWSSGLKHITSPTDIVERVGQDQADRMHGRANGSSRGKLLDLLKHLTGHLPPGVSSIPPACFTAVEKLKQHYHELNAALRMMRNDGGMLGLTTPDLLMDYSDYATWTNYQHTSDLSPAASGGGASQKHTSTTSAINPSSSANDGVMSEDEFNHSSLKIWTVLLAQLMKLYVLPRVLTQVPSHILRQVMEREEEVEMEEGECSNVYSRAEMVLLEWLNYYYTRYSRRVFGNGAVSRQVSSFDLDLMDCTVLACAVAAHVPHLVESHLCKMYSEPSTPEQCTHNALLLVNALNSIGINYDIQASDLSAPNPLSLVLFTAHLLLALPHYTPSHTLTLEAPTHSPTSYKITVDNPSSRPLIYTAMIKGQDANSFSVPDSTIKLCGRKSVEVVVHFTGHHARAHTALLLLVGEIGVGLRGQTLSFTLQGNITGAPPLVNTKVTAGLFSTVEFPLSFMSPFPQSADFTVSLFEGKVIPSLTASCSPPKQQTKGKKKRRSKQAVAIIPITALQHRSDCSMRVFHCEQKNVTLSGDGKINSVRLLVTPLKVDSRQCHVLLRNPEFGDIAVTATLSVALPSPSFPLSSKLHQSTVMDEQKRTLHLKVLSGELVREELIIESSNPLLEQAAITISKWGMSEEEKRRRELTNTMKYASLRSAIEALELDDSPKSHWNKMSTGSDKVHYTVKSTCDLLRVPEAVSVQGKEGGRSILPMEFIAEYEGHYSCEVVLASRYDVRVYNVEVTVMGRGRCAVMEMRTSALQPLTQEIPLVNPSTMDWLLQASITGVGYKGADRITVRALSTSYYSLTFSPRWEGNMEGELVLTNAGDGSQHCFKLLGIAERPLALDTIKIHTQAKKRTAHILHVPNSSDRTTLYRVETDLECVSGPPTVSVSGGDVVDYPIMVEPLERGQWSGAVVFKTEARSGKIRGSGVLEHLWFRVELTVDPAPSDYTHYIRGHVFSTSIADLILDNPFDHNLDLQVSIDGDSITGPSRVTLEPHSELAYPLTYSPHCVGDTTGSIVLMGRPDGELMYRLELEALDPEPVSVPLLTSELGKSSQETVLLNNPLSSDVIVSCCCSNSDHFTIPGVNNNKLLLPAHSAVELKVIFAPSQLTNRENGRLVVTSREFGQQLFLLEGKGNRPSEMPLTTILAPLSGSAVTTITFTNPLHHFSHFTVTLANNDGDQFCLLLKRSRHIYLDRGVSLDIPILYAPDSMTRSETVLTVCAGDGGLKWSYPIVGDPQLVAEVGKNTPRIVGRARERVEERVVVKLVTAIRGDLVSVRPVTPGSPSDEKEEKKLWEKYKYRLVYGGTDEEERRMFERSTGVSLVREDIMEDNTTALVFTVTFMPSKPFSSSAQLHVQPSDHGLWQFPILFKAKGVVPDDVITLQAHSISRVTTVGIRLTSTKDLPADFTARFSAGSSPELKVEPASGVLPPITERGTLLTLSYRPRSFNRSCTGRLIVETAHNQWCYTVNGQPVHRSPLAQSKVDHRSPLSLSSKLGHRSVPTSLKHYSNRNSIQQQQQLSYR